MEIFRGDYVRLGNIEDCKSYSGKIVRVTEVCSKRDYKSNGEVEYTQLIYTPLRLKAFTEKEIEASSYDKKKLYKRRKKETDTNE